MIHLEQDFPLQQLNTFGIAASARYFAAFSSEAELVEILDFVSDTNLPFFVLGGGANLLLTKDYDGVVIHPVSNGIFLEGETVIAESGVVWDHLVETTVRAGLGGLENLSLIPGSVGAAPVQNIGAYGVEAGDSVLWVEYMDVVDREVHRIPGGECKFGYRDSVFKHDLASRAVILRVAFGLSYESSSYRYRLDYGALKTSVSVPSLENIRSAVIDIRRSKLPDPAVTGNAGSFFRNPEVSSDEFVAIKQSYPDVVAFALPDGRFKISAGWLIEKTGWKGRSLGPAAVHDRQALVLVNCGGASGKDVLALCDRIRNDVACKFGIELHPEVIVL